MSCYNCGQENEYGAGCDMCDEYYCEDCLNGDCGWSMCNLCCNDWLMCGECMEKHHKCLTCNKGTSCGCPIRNCQNTEKVTKEREEGLKKYIMEKLNSDNPSIKKSAENALIYICENINTEV